MAGDRNDVGIAQLERGRHVFGDCASAVLGKQFRCFGSFFVAFGYYIAAGGDGLDADHAERDIKRGVGNELLLYDGGLGVELWKLGAIPVRVGRRDHFRLARDWNDIRVPLVECTGVVYRDSPGEVSGQYLSGFERVFWS